MRNEKWEINIMPVVHQPIIPPLMPSGNMATATLWRQYGNNMATA